MSKFHHGWTTSVGAFFRFEWGLDLTAMGNAASKVGQIIGFEVATGDRDTDGSFTWMGWGEGVGKLGAPSRRGDLILLPAGDTATITGRVAWAGDGIGVPSRRLGITSAAGWVRVAADAEGTYALQLPDGAYEVATHDVRIRQSGSSVADIPRCRG